MISKKMRIWFGRWTPEEMKKRAPNPNTILPLPSAIYPNGRMLRCIILPMPCCRVYPYGYICNMYCEWWPPPLTIRFICDMLYNNGPIDITVQVFSLDASSSSVMTLRRVSGFMESILLLESDYNHAKGILSGRTVAAAAIAAH